jgi:hypothetical protein
MTPEMMPASKPNRKPPSETTKAIKSVFLVILFQQTSVCSYVFSKYLYQKKKV